MTVETTAELRVVRERKYLLKGRGLEVTVPYELTRAQVACLLSELAADMLSDLQAEAGEEQNETLFLRAEMARSTLRFAAEACDEVAKGNGVLPDPAPMEPPQETSDVACTECNADATKPCMDQRPGRNLRKMNGYHPARHEAFRKARS